MCLKVHAVPQYYKEEKLNMATITNQATCEYHILGESETNTAESNVNEITLQAAGRLDLVKIAAPTQFVAGDIINYSVKITNNSTTYLSGVRIIDNLGGGNLAYVVGSGRVTANGSSYAVNPVATNPLTFTLQQLNIGQTITLVYKCQVIFNLPSTVTSITNQVQGIGYTSTGTITGNASSTITRRINTSLTMTKTASLTNVQPGQNFDYRLTFTNPSDDIYQLAGVADQLPNGFVLNSITSKEGSSSPVTLTSSDYTLSSGNLLAIVTAAGSPIYVPSHGSTLITINGHF